MRALLLQMDVGKMDDGGMYVWAGILTVVGLVASYLIALAWQRRNRGAQKTREQARDEARD